MAAFGGRFRGRRRRRKAAHAPEVGIFARSQRGAIGESWWSHRFIQVLESFTIGTRLQRGRTYARGGNVLELNVEPGLVTARVQGSVRVPYDVEVTVDTVPAVDWRRVEHALGAQALFAARLLAGEMPREIEEVFSALGLSLFPATADEVSTACSCPDAANPCKHIAATFYILAEAFDDDPFLIFAWRGRSRESLIANLRALRGTGAGAADEQDDAASLSEDLPDIPVAAGDFWRSDPAFTGVRITPQASASPDALVRQIGPAPAEIGGAALLERLASLYRSIATGAEILAFGDAGDERSESSVRSGRPGT